MQQQLRLEPHPRNCRLPVSLRQRFRRPPAAAAHAEAAHIIEAPWVSTPATVAGRWRARRLNNVSCWLAPAAAAHAEAAHIIEAPWVSTPATVAGRWRARRLNNVSCWLTPAAAAHAEACRRRSADHRGSTATLQRTRPARCCGTDLVTCDYAVWQIQNRQQAVMATLCCKSTHVNCGIRWRLRCEQCSARVEYSSLVRCDITIR
jgi:hypothetical protein